MFGWAAFIGCFAARRALPVFSLQFVTDLRRIINAS
jgi:hypothetical protein